MTHYNEIIINDEMRLYVNESNTEQKEKVNEAVSEKTTAQEPGRKSKVTNAAAGVGGVMAGMGGVMPLMSFKEPEIPISNPDADIEPIPEPSHFDGTEISVALGVNSNMSFDEAFAAARHEVGTGGVFQWRGHMYSTYYAEEWQGFSDEYKQVFSNYHYDHADLSSEELVTVAEIVADDYAYVHEVPMAFVDTDFDGSYDIAVISDADHHEIPLVYLHDDSGVISYESPSYDMSSDHWADFYNDADISNFV